MENMENNSEKDKQFCAFRCSKITAINTSYERQYFVC